MVRSSRGPRLPLVCTPYSIRPTGTPTTGPVRRVYQLYPLQAVCPLHRASGVLCRPCAICTKPVVPTAGSVHAAQCRPPLTCTCTPV